MNEEVRIKSHNLSLIYFIFLIILGLISLFLGFLMFYYASKGSYPEISIVIIGFLFVIFGLYSIFSIYSYDSIFIYKDRFETRSVFGNTKKVFFFKDINYWIEIYIEPSPGPVRQKLTVYSDKTKYKLISYFYKNYPDLKYAITKGKNRDHNQEKKWFLKTNIYHSVASTIIGLMFISFGWHNYITSTNEVKSFELQTITSVMSDSALIRKGGQSSFININIKSFPSFTFRINSYAYSATNSVGFFTNVGPNHTISIDVLKDDYQKKLSEEKKLDLFDKYVNFSEISVYGLRDKNRVYLDLEGYNSKAKEGKQRDSLLLTIAGLLCLIGAYSLFRDK